MDIPGIKGLLADRLRTVANVRKSFSEHPASIPITPAIVVGQPKAQITPGNRQLTLLTQPFRVYVGKIDDARTEALINPLAQGCLNALAPISSAMPSNSLLWNSITAIEFDTDKYYEVSGVSYQAIDFTLHMSISETNSLNDALV